MTNLMIAQISLIQKAPLNQSRREYLTACRSVYLHSQTRYLINTFLKHRVAQDHHESDLSSVRVLHTNNNILAEMSSKK